MKRIQKRSEIADLFAKYAKGDLMTAEELCDFFHLEQSVFTILQPYIIVVFLLTFAYRKLTGLPKSAKQ